MGAKAGRDFFAQRRGVVVSGPTRTISLAETQKFVLRTGPAPALLRGWSRTGSLTAGLGGRPSPRG